MKTCEIYENELSCLNCPYPISKVPCAFDAYSAKKKRPVRETTLQGAQKKNNTQTIPEKQGFVNTQVSRSLFANRWPPVYAKRYAKAAWRFQRRSCPHCLRRRENHCHANDGGKGVFSLTRDTYIESALTRQEALEIYAEELEIPCDVCGCMMPPDEVCRLGNRQLCDDCFVDICNALYEKYSKAFMDYKMHRYLEFHEIPLDSDELPVNYWLSGCSKEERAHILGLACAAAEKFHGVGYDEGWKQAYCLEDPEWTEFVTEQENMS